MNQTAEQMLDELFARARPGSGVSTLYGPQFFTMPGSDQLFYGEAMKGATIVTVDQHTKDAVEAHLNPQANVTLEDFEPRWLLHIDYRYDDGLRRKTFAIDELAEIDDIVEAGPHYDTVGKISVTRVNHCTRADLTVEQAATL